MSGETPQIAALVQVSAYVGFNMYVGKKTTVVTTAVDTVAWNSHVQAIKTAVTEVTCVDTNAITSGEATAIVQALRNILLTF